MEPDGSVADLVSYRLLIADVYELAGACRRSSEAIARQVGQTAARWHVLSVLSDRPRTVAGAARRLRQARQSVQRVVDDLAEARQVDLVDNPDHARAPLVRVTPAGAATLETLVRRSDLDRAQLLDRATIGPDDLDDARRVLRALIEALNTVGDPGRDDSARPPSPGVSRLAGGGRFRGHTGTRRR